MAYRDNVSALAAKLGISNDPGLHEEDLKISKLIFYNENKAESVTIDATPMNRGGRLFFQSQSVHPHGGKLRQFVKLDEIRGQAEEYFAELWEPNPEPGKRALLDAIRKPEHYGVWLGLKDE